MTCHRPSPLLDGRDAAALAAELLGRVPAFVPGWRPREGEAGTALVHVYARYLQTLARTLNRVPDKAQLALYDALGVALLPPAAARAPVVFSAMPQAGDTQVPAGTQIGATVAGQPDPLVFETESALGLARSRLHQVVSLDPLRDRYTDHTEAALRGDPVRLFEAQDGVEHVWYLAHDGVLALSGQATVELAVELATPAAEPLALAWQHWDGETWRNFRPMRPADEAGPRDSADFTAGLTRSGTVRLVSDCGRGAPTAVAGHTNRWIRAVLETPLPPGSETLPSVERVRVSSVLDRSLRSGSCGSPVIDEGIAPDQGLGGSDALDFSKAVEPLGSSPKVGTAFYLACDEVLARPGAEATLCFVRPERPEEAVDVLGAEYEEDADNAQRLVCRAALDACAALRDIARSLLQLAVNPATNPVAIAELLTALAQLDVALNTAETAYTQATTAVPPRGVDLEAVLNPLVDPARTLMEKATAVNTGLVNVAGGLDLLNPNVGALVALILGFPGPWAVIGMVLDFVFTNLTRTVDAGPHARNAARHAHSAFAVLESLTPIDAVRAGGAHIPELPTPVVRWEYYDGRRWRSLGASGTPEARRFQADGPITFTVPDDLAAVEVNGTEARWIRARLTSGGYGNVRMVSWRDAESQRLNFFPIIQYRPPVIDRVRLGYTLRTRPAPLERVLCHNDFRYADATEAARERGQTFEPFVPVEDTTPVVYFGFDRALPRDQVGLYLGLEESTLPRVPLVWEYHDGSAWRPVRVTDGTRDLTVPGIVQVLWPGHAPVPRALLRSARGRVVTLADAAEAAPFRAGDQVEVGDAEPGELAAIEAVTGDTVALVTPLAGEHRAGYLRPADLPRFGIPLVWLKVRLRDATSPPVRRGAGFHLNAVWAVQRRTVEFEPLGTGSGEPAQVVFARQAPVLEDEWVEVRELAGERAAIEEPLLRRELLDAGLTEDDITTTREPRTGRTNEVWVRWHEIPNLLFAGPGERVYVVERTRGRIVFGGPPYGMAPPAGSAIRLRRYRTGGGAAGNVAAGAIDRILAGVLAQGVTNPRAAEGGADAEPAEAVLGRGPAVLRHHRQALAQRDYEALAVEASPAVAVARAVPTAEPSGRRLAGAVTVQVVPRSQAPEPVPTFELRDHVARFIAARMPAGMAPGLRVIAPHYLEVGVEAVLAPVDAGQGGPVLERATAALRAFLHPLTGGPGGCGWPFGRDVFASDVAALLESIAGLDYVQELRLLVDGTPVGDAVAVPVDRLVAAGPLRLTFAGGAA